MYHHRLASKEMPDKDELVICEITNISEVSVMAKLLEYGYVEGMITLNNLSRKRIKKPTQFTRIGKIEVTRVIAIDKGKKCIDLSKTEVSSEEAKEMLLKYDYNKKADTVMKKYVFSYNDKYNDTKSINDIYELFGYGLFEKYHSLHSLFNEITETNNYNLVDGFEIDKEILQKSLESCYRKEEEKPEKNIRIECVKGIMCIKNAYQEALNEIPNVNIKTIDGVSYYVYSSESKLKLDEFIKLLRVKLNTFGGLVYDN